MNKKTLIIYIGIACLLVILTCLSYFNTRKRMLEVAERTFVEAVHLDLDERWKKSGETITFSSGVEKNLYVDFTMKEEDAEKSYSLKDINYSQNVDKEFRERILHSVASDLSLECLPDTLQSCIPRFPDQTAFRHYYEVRKEYGFSEDGYDNIGPNSWRQRHPPH